MNDACPVSRSRTDQNVCRIVAGLAAAVLVAGLVSRSAWLLALLTVDFAVRGWGSPRFSPLVWSARGVRAVLGLEDRPIDAAPKRFAARIGTTLSASAAALLAFGLTVPGVGVGVVLGFCASLEALFGVCVGCRMYALLPAKVAAALAR